ncbi:MAG: site-specific integrase [Clostridiales bacterium]|nr:site-specific integrase [Clostridiales bacterium]
MKYKDWLYEWLENTVKPTAKFRTYEKYGRIVKNQLTPKLGEYELNELNAQRLQAFVAELCGKYAANTVTGIITVINLSLERASKVGVIDRHYADSIIYPRIEDGEVACFSVAEQKRIERYVTESGKDKLFGIILCLYTGLRIGELLALKWQDIDFNKGLISITKSCRDTWVNGKYVKVFDTPKTINSRRIIPLPKQLIPPLRAIKKRSDGEMAVSANGAEQISIRSYQRTFELLLKKIKIEHKGFHVLRHTFATRAIECGMDVKTLSEILGHKNPTVTLKKYVRSLLEHKTAMMNKLGKLFE